MNIDGVENGIVIDHITAGECMKLYHLLGLDDLDCTVAIIKNVTSGKYGKKDIIKIDALIDLDVDALGYIDPRITVNIVENSRLVEKRHLELPQLLRNIVRCKNPRCITSVEADADQVFRLADAEQRLYRCVYCEVAPDREGE
ncbi:aspartate carbamoyltransferase regulatory subunit [Scrofimicrobium sp. R131]|uniref:Aspartate carbamoyltransferase regulatory subunit n=1 Tax=Scrofimicrobium appendicitidis TaxID=3079930 RepID=A0AAU7V7A5_9ACTO